MPTILLVH